jgi:hypothetical protein
VYAVPQPPSVVVVLARAQLHDPVASLSDQSAAAIITFVDHRIVRAAYQTAISFTFITSPAISQDMSR